MAEVIREIVTGPKLGAQMGAVCAALDYNRRIGFEAVNLTVVSVPLLGNQNSGECENNGDIDERWLFDRMKSRPGMPDGVEMGRRFKVVTISLSGRYSINDATIFQSRKIVDLSDGVVIFSDRGAVGLPEVTRYCDVVRKPFMICEQPEPLSVAKWCVENSIQSLGIVGLREINCPGIQESVFGVISDTFGLAQNLSA